MIKGDMVMNMKNRILKRMKIGAMLMASLFMMGCGVKESVAGNSSTEDSTVVASNESKTISNADNSNVDSSEANKPVEPVELTILAAASLTDVCNEIKKKYEAEHENVTLNFSYGGSGALQTQIEEGAPADIFLSAATKQMTALNEQGLMYSESIVELLENKVVLIVPADNVTCSTTNSTANSMDNVADSTSAVNTTADSTVVITTFEDIVTDKVNMIGLGEPGSVPVGQYSEEIFENLGILDEVKKKANYGLDVRTVLSWVETGEVDCGIVYATDAYTTDKVKIVAEAPEESCKQVIYPAGIVKSTDNVEAAKAFMAYLQEDEIMELFENYGFTALQ